MGGTCSQCALYKSLPTLFFSSLFVNQFYVLSRAGFVYIFFPFLLIHCYFIACLVSSTSSVLSCFICLLSRSAFIVPLVPHKTCTKTIPLLQMITEISRILYNSLLSEQARQKTDSKLDLCETLTDQLTNRGRVERWGS